MRVLITGASGFVGRHLINHLLVTMPDAELHGTIYQVSPQTMPSSGHWYDVDLRNPADVQDLIATVRPDHIYHLAGQAFVPQSFDDPWDTLETNIRPQLNLILACLACGIKPRFLVTASAEVYGIAKTVPITEDAPFLPSSPYSVSKVVQDLLGLQYAQSHELPLLRVRAFNHLGPGQSDRFVAPAFAMQIARIEAGLQAPVLSVGDLSARRDFTDVRDIVQAYRLIVAHGVGGEAYNVASGKAHSIQYLLDTLLSYTTTPIDIEVDKTRFRPNHLPILQGDVTKLQEATGWKPEIPFEQTLKDVLEDCRQRLQSQL